MIFGTLALCWPLRPATSGEPDAVRVRASKALRPGLQVVLGSAARRAVPGGVHIAGRPLRPRRRVFVKWMRARLPYRSIAGQR